MRYEIIVGGTVLTTANSEEEAKKILAEARKSPLGWVHPYNCFYIREVK